MELRIRLTPAAWDVLQRAMARAQSRAGVALSDGEALERLAREVLALEGDRDPPHAAEAAEATEAAGSDLEDEAEVSIGPGDPHLHAEAPETTPGGPPVLPDGALAQWGLEDFQEPAMKILETMSNGESWDADGLCRTARLSAAEVSVCLTALLALRAIDDHPTGYRLLPRSLYS